MKNVFMSMESPKTLSDFFARYPQVLLGTKKQETFYSFEEETGVRPTAVDPEIINCEEGERIEEPAEVDPTVAAKFKTDQVVESPLTQEINEDFAVFGVDVVFENSTRHLKPEREPFDEGDEALIQETIDWYCTDSFIVHWLIAFTVQNSDGLRRMAVLDVEGEFHNPLDQDLVENNFHPNMNARIPLVEIGKDGGATFRVSNSRGLHSELDEKIEISQELAQQLIVARVMPNAWLENFVLGDDSVQIEECNFPESSEYDGWEFVTIGLVNLLEN